VLPAINSGGATRRGQLGLGLICVMAISSPQYVWTLFAKSLARGPGCGSRRDPG
jgi:hypothetical protein